MRSPRLGSVDGRVEHPARDEREQAERHRGDREADSLLARQAVLDEQDQQDLDDDPAEDAAAEALVRHPHEDHRGDRECEDDGRAREAEGPEVPHELEPRDAEPAEVAHRAAELRLHELLRVLERLVHAGEDEILERLRVVRVDRLRLDRDRDDLACAVGLHGHHPAADRGLDGLLGELLLRLGHLGLHLLHLLQHLVDVHSLGHGPEGYPSSICWASNVDLKSETNSSSLVGPSSACSSPECSPTVNAGTSSRPVASWSAWRRIAVFFGSSARPRWNDAAAENSIVSVSPASATGRASFSTDANGIDCSCTPGRTAAVQSCCTCSSDTASPSGSGSGSATGSSAGFSALGGGGAGPSGGAGAGAPCSRDSSWSIRCESDCRERSAPGRVTFTSASSSGSLGSPPCRASSTATASRSISRSTTGSPSWFAWERSRSRVSSVTGTEAGTSPRCCTSSRWRRCSSRSATSRFRSCPWSASSSTNARRPAVSASTIRSPIRKSASSSTAPRSWRTDCTVTAPSVAAASWSSVETASRNEPRALRAIRASDASGASIFSPSAMRRRSFVSSESRGRANMNVWQRDRTVGS